MKAISGGMCALIAAFGGTPAAAQDMTSGEDMHVSVAATGGTLGIGPDVGVRFSDRFGARASATFLGVSRDFDSDDITYRGKLKLKSYGAMLDVYPFAGAFRVSGGARINRNRADVSASPTGTVEVGGTSYTAAQIGTLSGRATVKKFSPALTLGWGGSNSRGVFFAADAGVLFQGAAKLRRFRATGSLANDAGFNASLERERIDLQDDVDKVKVYPILQIGVGYRF